MKTILSVILIFISAFILQSCTGSNSDNSKALDWGDLIAQMDSIRSGKIKLLTGYNKIISIAPSPEKEFKIIGYSTIPAKNCLGNNMIRLNETLSKSTTVEYNFAANVGFDVSFFNVIKGSIGAEFGVTNGETLGRSFSFEVDVEPHSYSEYNIVWKEVWQKGIITVGNDKGDIEAVPFQIKNGIEYEQVSVKELKCED